MRNSGIMVAAVAFAVWVWPPGMVLADIPTEIQISTGRSQVKVCEPVVVGVTYVFDEPVISGRTNEAVRRIDPRAYVVIKDESGREVVPKYKAMELELAREDIDSARYSGHFMILNNFERGLLFKRVGRYTIQVNGWTKQSNVLTVEVEPATELEKRAMSLLSDPYDYVGLTAGSESDINKDPERLSRLQRVADECEGTVVGNLAAAAVGVQKSKELEAKYLDGEGFVAQYRQGKIAEPLVEQAYAYLSKGLRLADEFPVREEVLSQIIGTEIVRGNYDTAGAYADELGMKYPHGRYGSRAASTKETIRRLHSKELEQSGPEAASPEQDRGMLGVVVGIGVGILMIAVAIAVVMKQKSDRPKKSPETR